MFNNAISHAFRKHSPDCKTLEHDVDDETPGSILADAGLP